MKLPKSTTLKSPLYQSISGKNCRELIVDTVKTNKIHISNAIPAIPKNSCNTKLIGIHRIYRNHFKVF